MGFGRDQLRGKALLALEEVLQECRYRTPRRSLAVRFALAYLWTCGPEERAPFDAFWTALGAPHSPWSFGTADTALEQLYRALGLQRDEALTMRLWKARFAEEGEGRG